MAGKRSNRFWLVILGNALGAMLLPALELRGKGASK